MNCACTDRITFCAVSPGYLTFCVPKKAVFVMMTCYKSMLMSVDASIMAGGGASGDHMPHFAASDLDLHCLVSD